MQILLIHKKSTLCGNNLKSTLKQTGKESAKVKIVVLQQGHYTCLSFINNKLIDDNRFFKKNLLKHRVTRVSQCSGKLL